jgi:hypothetical protein
VDEPIDWKAVIINALKALTLILAPAIKGLAK